MTVEEIAETTQKHPTILKPQKKILIPVFLRLHNGFYIMDVLFTGAIFPLLHLPRTASENVSSAACSTH